jgi:hypothetical protein
MRRLSMWILAILIGSAATLMLSYKVDPQTRVLSFPLPAAFLQQDENGTRWTGSPRWSVGANPESHQIS